MRILAVVLLTTVACASVAAQARRDLAVKRIVARRQVALIVGENAYVHFNQLHNAVNDAEGLAQVLRSLHFEVLLVTNAGHRALDQEVDRFVARLGPGDVGFFYFAGHGVGANGENYLIPTDFAGSKEADLKYDALPAGKVEDRMEGSGAQLSILVLDACRNNPLSGRSAGSGLAAMSGARGTFIAFATAPGKTAEDNPTAPNGLFCTYLLKALASPSPGLNEVFDFVRARVDGASHGEQVPWTHSSVIGTYSFRPSVPETPSGPAAPFPGPVAAPPTYPAPNPRAANILGAWTGHYACSVGGGTTTYTISYDLAGRLQVEERWRRSFGGFETTGTVVYAAAWAEPSRSLHLVTDAMGGFEIALILSPDARRFEGKSIHHPHGCVTVSLQRAESGPGR